MSHPNALKLYAVLRLGSLLLMGTAYAGGHGDSEILGEENREVMPLQVGRHYDAAYQSSFVEGETSEPIVHASKKQVEAYKRHEAQYEEALVKSLKAHDKLEKAKKKGKDTSKLTKKVQKRDQRVHEIEEKLEEDIKVGVQQALLEKEVEKLDKKSFLQQTKEKVIKAFSSKKKAKTSESIIKPDSQEESDNILALHGGGFRGILELMQLKALEEETGLKTFELFKGGIYGTSTGGLAALMLARGMSAGEVLDVYLNNGNRIFSWSYSDYFTNPLGLFRSAYDATQLEAVIEEQVGDAMLADVKVPVGVVVQNVDTEEGILLSSASHPEVSMLDAGRGTSAATTYFDAKEIKTKNGTFIARDGGFSANDPSELALREYRRLNPGKKPSILTLGTGEVSVYKPHTMAGLWAFIHPGTDMEMMFHYQMTQTRKAMKDHKEIGDIDEYDYFNIQLPTKIDLADISSKSVALMQQLATTFIQTNEGFRAYIERRKQEVQKGQMLRLPQEREQVSIVNEPAQTNNIIDIAA
ncbi:MAG: patatin-like phospholipase family protein [Candidatus Paracaedimonas acanthamoebae]|uniref:Patatin-like phospholipase family protein n=1 Tax=Candidatus Paracaedimonas acanthamoebae TaxID=244581 RepID=A0A8J7PXS2_9PROT|nr:patatin-like phospholipase family protein [Candidatus Paracaedimonas acanthamoebae]